VTPLKQRSQLETQVARVEREIAKIDARRAEIDAIFADPATYEDRERVKALQEETQALEAASTQAILHWERLLEQLEALL
jgi:ATP-binding cassette subfamily F protein 3